MKKRLSILLIAIVTFSALIIVVPQKVEAAGPTVKMGGVALTADNAWHAYNSKKPTISGWTAGKYKLSTDGKTLELSGIKYSGSKRGIYSSAALTVVVSGTNTFTCNKARGIGLGADDDNLKNLTLKGSGTLNLKCTDARSICVNTCTLSAGTVKATGHIYCETNYNQSAGTMNVTGNIYARNNSNVSGGTLTISGMLRAYNKASFSGGKTTATGNINTGEYEVGEDEFWYLEDTGYLSITGGTVSVKNANVLTGASIGGGELTCSGNLNVGRISDLWTDTGTYAKISKGTVSVKNLNINANTTVSGGTIKATGYIEIDENLTSSGGTINATGYIETMGNISGSGGSITSSKGIYVYGNCSLSGLSVTASTQGIDISGNLTVSKGTLTGKNTSGENGIYVQGNSTISGTGKVVANTGNYIAFYTEGTLTVSAGTVEATNNSADGWDAIRAKNFKISGGTITSNTKGSVGNALYIENGATVNGGTINANGWFQSNTLSLIAGALNAKTDISVSQSFTGSGGSATASGQVYVGGNLSLSGANVIATSKGVYVGGNLVLSKGTLTGKNTSGFIGIHIEGNSTISDTGKLIATAEDQKAFLTNGNLTVKGGSIESTNNATDNGEGRTCLFAKDIVISGGTVTASAKGTSGKGIYADGKIKVSGGKLSGSSNVSEGIFTSGFSMTGGKVEAKTASGWTAFYAYDEDGYIDIADDIWVSKPELGRINSRQGIHYLEIYDQGYDYAKDVVLQKVSSISVKEGPSTQMYEGDILDPYGLVLNVEYEDGTASTTICNYYTRDIFTFDIPEYELLTAGTKTLGITCFTKTTSTNFTVASFVAPRISGSVKSNSILVAWMPVDGASRYNVYAKNAGENTYNFVRSVWGTYYMETGLSPGTSKDYYVVAVRYTTAGEIAYSDRSNELRLTTELTAPTIELSGTTYNSATIKWSEEEGAEDYLVYRADESGEYILVDTVKENEFTDTDLTTGVTYTYYVVAAIETKNLYSPDSNLVSATPAFTGKPTLTVSNNKKNYDLSWTAVDGATGYELWRGSDKNGSRSRIASVDAVSYNDASASCYATYNYVVKAYRVVGDQKFYASDSAKVVSTPIIKESFTDKEIDKAPVDKKIKKISKIRTVAYPSKKSMLIEFEKVAGAYDYRIEYRKRGEKTWKKKWTGKKNSIMIKGMKNGQFLEFRFAAYKYKDGKLRRGLYSTTSYRWYVKTTGSVKPSKNSVTIKMKKYKGATGYKVFYADAKTPNKLKSKQSTGTKITVKGLKKGRTYIIRYRPIKKIGKNVYEGMIVEKKVKIK